MAPPWAINAAKVLYSPVLPVCHSLKNRALNVVFVLVFALAAILSAAGIDDGGTSVALSVTFGVLSVAFIGALVYNSVSRTKGEYECDYPAFVRGWEEANRQKERRRITKQQHGREREAQQERETRYARKEKEARTNLALLARRKNE